MDFVTYLLSSEIITEEQYEEIKQEMRRKNAKIGNVLIRNNVLPYDEVLHHINYYAKKTV